MPLPRTPKSAKKQSTPKKEVSKKQEEEKVPVPPTSEQLLEQKKKENSRIMEEQLKALMRQRDAVERRMKRVQAELETTAAAPNENLKNLNFLKYQLGNINSAFSKFTEYQEQIYAMVLSAEEQANHEQYELDFEKLRRGLTLTVNDLIERLEKRAVNAALVPAAPSHAAVPSYLPPLNVPLPTFDGTFETWYSFKSMFTNVMARYTNEAPAIKLYHLRNSLVGKAAGVIDQDIINNNDYDAAWAILEERYEDKRAIVDKHIDAIYALPKISRDNAGELRKLIDNCIKNIEALKTLQLPVEGLGEQMLVNLLGSRMDKDTRRAWETEQKVGVLPTYEATIKFLKERCRVLERVEAKHVTAEVVSLPRSVTLAVTSDVECTECHQPHGLMRCEQFLQKTVNERYTHLRKCGLCFNCLKKGHRVADCASVNTCRICAKRHHSMLHTGGMKKRETGLDSTAKDSLKQRDEHRLRPGQSFGGSAEIRESSLLPTAVVNVYGEDGTPHEGRVLIDSCSQNNFITERFANLLAIRRERASCEVSGLNGGRTRVSNLVRAEIKSRVTPFSRKLQLWISPRIVEDVPPRTIDVSEWNLPLDVELADPTFYRTGRVDMLLGAGVFWDLLKSGKVALKDGLPSLRETELGWIVGGALPTQTSGTTRLFCGVISNT